MFLIPDDSWEVRKTKTKGRGIFTLKDIDAGIVIGDYIGKVIRTAEESEIDEKDNFYLMFYHDYASIFPDVKKPGIHLLNHSCTPNVWMYTYFGHTLFFAIRHIFSGEELTVSYLLSPQKYCKDCNHYCACGSVLCFQSMHLSEKQHDAWAELQEKENAKTKRLRITYGKNLLPLKKYPDSLPDEPMYILFGAEGHESINRNDEVMPTVHELRHLIRESGRTIAFPKLGQRVLGITDKYLYSEPITT